MSIEPLLASVVLVAPLAGALVSALLWLVGAPRRLFEATALASSMSALVAAVILYVYGCGCGVYRLPLLPFAPPAATVMLVTDFLSRFFALLVALIGFLVTLYSVGYMGEDPWYARYYTLLQLFIGSMEGLVLAGNLALLYVFWEAVGLCSFALIAHQYRVNPWALPAGLKALLVTRFSDLFLAAGLAYAYSLAGSLDYTSLSLIGRDSATVLFLLSVAAALGKSAQVPLHVWLPDAMEGPTPVSALLHSATMVKAGAYLVARMVLVTHPYAWAAMPVAAVGAITALYAALCACAQVDAKRMLAYSTISQLGYIFAALGAFASGSAPLEPPLLHILSHAVFKSLLFLVVGVVAVELEDILGPRGARSLALARGALRGNWLLTACLAAGALSLAGLPPFSGFASKDEVVAAVWSYSPVLGFILAAAGFATAYYALSLLHALSFSEPRDPALVVKEVKSSMLVPCLALAALTLLAPLAFGLHVTVEPWGLVYSVSAVTLAYLLVRRGVRLPSRLAVAFREGLYVDRFVSRAVAPVVWWVTGMLGKGLARSVDAGVDTLAYAVARASRSLGEGHPKRLDAMLAYSLIGLTLLILVALVAMRMG